MSEGTSELRVRITRRGDGGVVLHCTRADGTVTWQRQDGRHALFFPFHDLTHFAVETTLRFRRGFYGLIADGWDVADTGGKGGRGPLPNEAVLVEHVVGLLDRERVGGAEPLAAEDFNAQLALLAATGRVAIPYRVTDAQLAAVRERTAALHARFAELGPGGTLELTFGT